MLGRESSFGAGRSEESSYGFIEGMSILPDEFCLKAAGKYSAHFCPHRNFIKL